MAIEWLGLHVTCLSPGTLPSWSPGPGRPVPEGRQSHRGRELGQLEARVHADGVAQLLPEDAFLAVVGQLEQVEAGGGGGQTAARLPLADGEEASENAAQGVPRVLVIRHFDTADGEGRLEVGESQERGPGAAGHKLQKHCSLVGREVGGQNVPEPGNYPVTSMKTTVVHCVLPGNNADNGLRHTFCWAPTDTDRQGG